MPLQIRERQANITAKVHCHRLNPAEVELQVLFHCADVISDPELKGRLMGPRNVYGETVEIAYPLRPLRSENAAEYVGRIVIPEPSFWDPIAPLHYVGPLEFWDGDIPLLKAWATLGFFSRQVVRGKVISNGKPLTINGRELSQLDDDTVRQLRHKNINTVILPVDDKIIEHCELSDRFGMLLLFSPTLPVSQDVIESVSEYASCLGWILPADMEFPGTHSTLLGVDATGSPIPANLTRCHFIYGEESTIEPCELPKLILGRTSSQQSDILGIINKE